MKAQLRKQMLLLKNQLTKEQIKEYSKEIEKKLLESQVYSQCNTIYTYVAFNQEVQTQKIILRGLEENKRIAVPKVLKDRIEFFYIESFDDLVPGCKGILEPINKKIAFDKDVLMIMPGLAFDLIHNRLGYGGGYYDKYISTHRDSNFHKIALAYDFQVVPKMETNFYDQKVDSIITPTRLL
jgi:5-formyltetrahydrofolate cyclo-ligase